MLLLWPANGNRVDYFIVYLMISLMRNLNLPTSRGLGMLLRMCGPSFLKTSSKDNISRKANR